MMRIPISQYLLTDGLRPSRASGFKRYCLFQGQGAFGLRRIFTGGTFMASPGLETSHTWGLTHLRKGRTPRFLHLTANIQTPGKGNCQLLAFPKSL